MRRLLLTVIVAGSFAFAFPSIAAADRFEGYVGGVASGKGHHFVVGDGINLVFIDRRQSFTAYRVCWHRLHHSHHRCWHGETGRRGNKDRIFTAAPSFAGTYIVKWTVRHHRKAIWHFSNGVGD